MPAYSTISKGLNEAQTVVWETALASSGLSRSDAIEQALRLFVEAHGQLLWPTTAPQGGARVTVSEMVDLLNVLMRNQDGEDYERRCIPEDTAPGVIKYAVDHGYCVQYPNGMAAPTQAGELWWYNNT